MKKPIASVTEALSVAIRIIKAQDNLLRAYRIGGEPRGSSIDYLMENKPRLENWLSAGKAE